MDIFMVILWIILCVLAVVGSILPWIPGPQLSYIAIFLAQVFMDEPFSSWFVIIWWILVVVLMVLDYYLPILWTKKFWGSKWWNRWCIIWIMVWLFVWPVGLILWPFAGALMWEFLHQYDIQKSIKPAFGAFVGFLSGVLLKLVVSLILLVYFCEGCYNHFFVTLDSFPVEENELTSLL